MKNVTIYALLYCLLAVGNASAQSEPIDPYQTIQAEAYDDQNGVRLSNNGTAVGYIQDGDYIRFDAVDFGRGPLSGTIRASSNTSGGTIEFRTGSPTGIRIAEATITNTGGWNSFRAFDINVLQANQYADGTVFLGTETLYLVFTGGSGYLLDIDQFSFEPADVVATSISINNCPTEIELGTTYDFDVTITPANTTNQTVAFTATGGADIDYLSGEYTATSLGTKTVSVTSFSDGSLSDQCTFEVVAPEPVNPYQTIQAEDFDDQNGVRLSNNGAAVGYIQDGDYIGFTNLDFGNEGGKSFTVRAASNTSGGTIEYRLDSPTGDLVGTVEIPNTGGWTSFDYFTVNNTAGYIYNTVDIYLVFRGGNGYLLDVDEFVFSTDVIATGVSITNCPTQIELGTTYDFDVEVTPSNTTNQFVAFYADDGLSVDYVSGEYTATSLGTKTVSVTSFSDGSLSDQCTFEVVESTSSRTDTSAKPKLTGDEPQLSTGTLRVYPNPGQGTFKVNIAPQTRITVTDMVGRVIIPESLLDNAVIDLSDHPRGTYLLRTATGQTTKLIKE